MMDGISFDASSKIEIGTFGVMESTTRNSSCGTLSASSGFLILRMRQCSTFQPPSHVASSSHANWVARRLYVLVATRSRM